MIDANTELVWNGEKLEIELANLPDFIRENDLPFFLSVQEYVKDKLKKWIDIQAAVEKDPERAQGMKDLIWQMDRSPGLDRLLRGLQVEPCVIKSHGSAWYDLMEKGHDYAMDCYTTNLYNEEAFRIDGERWIIDHKVDDEVYYVHYEDDPRSEMYRLNKMSKEEVREYLHPRLWRASDGKEKYSWRLEKVEA